MVRSNDDNGALVTLYKSGDASFKKMILKHYMNKKIGSLFFKPLMSFYSELKAENFHITK